jgi:predicted ATPase
MLTRLKAHNFKSLRDLNLAFGPLNVLVGSNMSGKSNILSALRFLRQSAFPAGGALGLNFAIAQHGGISEILWKGEDDGTIGGEISKPMRIGVESDEDIAPGDAYKYDLEIITGAGNYVSLSNESLKITRAGEEHDLMFQRQGIGWLKNANGVELGGVSTAADTALRHGSANWDGLGFQTWVRNWRFYHLIPPTMKESRPTSEGEILTEDGHNLAAWLMWLQAHSPEAFARITEVLSSLFPEIRSFKAIPTSEGRVYLLATESGLRSGTRAFQFSDGFLTFAALLSLIYAPPDLAGSVVCIEEPENHLHPRIMETLVSLLRQVQQEVRDSKRSRTQFIITTQSPYLVDQFTLDEVIWVEKKKGETKAFRPSDRKHLKKLVEDRELGLGDLMFTGALGEE